MQTRHAYAVPLASGISVYGGDATVSVGQIVFGGVIIAGLVAAAAGFGAVQWAALRKLGTQPDLPADERSFEWWKAWRRLFGCGLLVVMAVLLTLQLVYWEAPAGEFAEERAAAGANAPPFTEDQKRFLRVWGGAWVALMAALFVLLMLTAYDQFVSRSRVWREMRRLQADRRAMIRRQAERLRQEREE